MGSGWIGLRGMWRGKDRRRDWRGFVVGVTGWRGEGIGREEGGKGGV